MHLLTGMMDDQGDRQHLPLTACYVVLQRGSAAQWTSLGRASQSVQVLTPALSFKLVG